jgi:hypothetical protein
VTFREKKGGGKQSALAQLLAEKKQKEDAAVANKYRDPKVSSQGRQL